MESVKLFISAIAVATIAAVTNSIIVLSISMILGIAGGYKLDKEESKRKPK